MIFDKKFRTNERNKLLLNTIALPTNGNVLDLSCGDGALLGMIRQLNPNLNLYGVDISESEIETATANSPQINFLQSEATNLSFPENNFDTIICSMSLHHYDNIKLVLAEIKRVLKDNGKIYFMDIIPANKFTQMIYNSIGCQEPYHFEKFYTADEIMQFISGYKLGLSQDSRASVVLRLEVMEFNK